MCCLSTFGFLFLEVLLLKSGSIEAGNNHILSDYRLYKKIYNDKRDIIIEWGMRGDKVMKKIDERISYPNPLKRREKYCNMNQGWEFSLDRETWQTINVPFCPQSKLSGIEYTDFIRQCFYRTTFNHIKSEEHVHLHFGAVDYRTDVYLNGIYVGSHTGGYTPFFFDITRYLQDGENEVTLVVFDENENMSFGKQSFKKKSFGCFYTRITGIWQDVWLEYVPEQYVKEFYFYPNIDDCSVEVELLTSHKDTLEQ